MPNLAELATWAALGLLLVGLLSIVERSARRRSQHPPAEIDSLSGYLKLLDARAWLSIAALLALVVGLLALGAWLDGGG